MNGPLFWTVEPVTACEVSTHHQPLAAVDRCAVHVGVAPRVRLGNNTSNCLWMTVIGQRVFVFGEIR